MAQPDPSTSAHAGSHATGIWTMRHDLPPVIQPYIRQKPLPSLKQDARI